MDSPRDKEKGAQIYIGHLSHRIQERDLEKEFKPFGEIKDVAVKRGFGFIVRDHFTPLN
jgi:splicing factor, arginine/serine-rich 4/5/6